MTRVKKLGTGIYFSAQKLIPVLLLVLCSFLKTFSVTTLDVGSSILFLTAYDGAYIPQTFIATAVLIFLIWPALTALKEKLSRLSLHQMMIKEWNSEVVFLHTVGEGAVDKSYGIHVGKLAGLPPVVVRRAEQILEKLESQVLDQIWE